MLKGTEVVQMAQDLARHASARQAEIARNVANADTPGYRARDLAPFDEVYSASAPAPMRTSREGHINAPDSLAMDARVFEARSEASPNGNSVSLEAEIVKTAEVRQSHGLALAVYQSSLDLMRAAVGRGR